MPLTSIKLHMALWLTSAATLIAGPAIAAERGAGDEPARFEVLSDNDYATTLAELERAIVEREFQIVRMTEPSDESPAAPKMARIFIEHPEISRQLQRCDSQVGNELPVQINVQKSPGGQVLISHPNPYAWLQEYQLRPCEEALAALAGSLRGLASGAADQLP